MRNAALTQTFVDMTTTLARMAEVEKPRVFICGARHARSFSGLRMDRTKVLCDGEYYYVDDRQLGLLQTGMDPADLELVAVEDAEDFS